MEGEIDFVLLLCDLGQLLLRASRASAMRFPVETNLRKEWGVGTAAGHLSSSGSCQILVSQHQQS